MENSTIRNNNFDLLRLFAAFQVFYFHACTHLLLKPGPIHAKFARLFCYFPGVPIFFIISGFLITLSLERNRDLKIFYQNRVLRIYPAFWITFLLSIFFLLISGFFKHTSISDNDFLTWVGCHITGFLFILGDCFKSLGYETINGSVYTISAELHFYLILPFFLFFLNKVKSRVGYISIFLFLIALSSALSHGLWHCRFNISARTQWLLLGSVFPNMYLFIFGILLAKYLHKIRHIIENKVIYWFILYIVFRIGLRNVFGGSLQDSYIVIVISHLFLAFFAISFAFSFRKLSNKLLKNFDISYGIYLFHALVFHTFVLFGLRGSWVYFWLSLLITLLMASLSWKFIEFPALKMKKWSLKHY